MHLQVCREEEKGKNTRALPLASPHRVGWGGAGRGGAWCGEARGGAWAHDVHVNSSPKSSSNPRRSAAFFYRLFLLRAHV
jgi:hypothetical protein